MQAHHDAAVVRALVAVVEQRDVPAWAHEAQKLQQGAGALGEFKAHQTFVLRQAGVPTDHVAQVLFGQFVVRQVQGFEALLVQAFGNLAALALALRAHAHKHVRLAGVDHPVVEFGDVARATGQGTDGL